MMPPPGLIREYVSRQRRVGWAVSQVKAAAVNVSQGCSKAAADGKSGCSEQTAFDVDLSVLRKQPCGFQAVLLPHGDLRDSSAWPEPFQGKLLICLGASSLGVGQQHNQLVCAALALQAVSQNQCAVGAWVLS